MFYICSQPLSETKYIISLLKRDINGLVKDKLVNYPYLINHKRNNNNELWYFDENTIR